MVGSLHPLYIFVVLIELPKVKDSLQYSPKQCTVVASYKRLVVGVALLSSPQETYITYLAVKVGWENAQIATWAIIRIRFSRREVSHWHTSTMLYHLITLNPNKDITLHVSANSPAMVGKFFFLILPWLISIFQLLYNRFGFKAEEFVAGFYEDYLDPQSRASKNAFRLRLRRWYIVHVQPVRWLSSGPAAL
jgi:hypothetical protein